MTVFVNSKLCSVRYYDKILREWNITVAKLMKEA